MLIDFNSIEETSCPGLYDGTGEMTAKISSSPFGKIIPSAIHKGGSIGMHAHPDSADINYIISGTGVAYTNGVEEELKPGVCHVCPRGSEHSIVNTGDEDLVMFTVVIELTKQIELEQARELAETQSKELLKQLDIVNSITKVFNCLYYIDMRDFSFVEVGVNLEGVEPVIGNSGNAKASFEMMYKYLVAPDYLDSIKEFTNLDTINERLKEEVWIAQEFFGPVGGWSEGVFIVANKDGNGDCEHIIWATRSIDVAKRKEQFLRNQSNTDELTRLYNRRAYEEAIKKYDESGIPDDLAYVSIDINGLKNVNDSLGHKAGDELIVGATSCMIQSLSAYGDIYRTGGDEFIALLHADRKQTKKLNASLEKAAAEWHGELVDSVSLSVGLVHRSEMPEATMHDIAVLADRKMYEAKSNYYKKKGVDRRGMQDIHVALCALYTKIFRINITTDTYQIVNIEETEFLAEKELSDKISDWFRSFGESDRILDEDRADFLSKTDLSYMREYFKAGNKMLTIKYHRRHDEAYQLGLMEIIPASDYTDRNQSLYLYVKNCNEWE